MAKKVQRNDGWLEHQRIEDSLDDAIAEYDIAIKPKTRRKRRKHQNKELKGKRNNNKNE